MYAVVHCSTLQFKMKSSKDNCLTFEEIENSDEPPLDFLLVTADGGGLGYGAECFAEIGRKNGKQILNLGSACLHEETVLHELVHTIGNILFIVTTQLNLISFTGTMLLVGTL